MELVRLIASTKLLKKKKMELINLKIDQFKSILDLEGRKVFKIFKPCPVLTMTNKIINCNFLFSENLNQLAK